MNTIDYLEALKERYKWVSDYRISKEMGLSPSRISNYRTGKSEMDEELCIKVAKLLNVNPAAVLIDITAERTKSKKASKILHDTAKQLLSAVASLFITIVVLSTTLYPSQIYATGLSTVSNTVYYVKYHYYLITRKLILKTLLFTLFFINRTNISSFRYILTNANKQGMSHIQWIC